MCQPYEGHMSWNDADKVFYDDFQFLFYIVFFVFLMFSLGPYEAKNAIVSPHFCLL